MRTRKLSMLFATAFIMTQGSTFANNDDPGGVAVSSFEEVDNSTIFYGFNKIYPSSIQMRIVDRYLEQLKTNPDTYIRVTSHTDDIGDWEINLNVSKKRALVIADYLTNYGVPQDRILLDWLGEDAPQYFTEEEKHKNRRTNIRIIKKVKYYPSPSVAATPAPIKTVIKPSVAPSIVTVVETKPEASVPAKVVSVPKPVLIEKPEPIINENIVSETPITTIQIAKVEDAKPQVRKVITQPSVETKPMSVVTKNPPLVQEKRVVIKPKVVTPQVSEVKEELVAKSGMTLPQKTIIFIDATTKSPVQVEVDLNTSKGKTSVSTSEKGELKVDMNDLKRDHLDVYAYGYFYKSVNIDVASEQQIVELNPTVSGNKIELNNLQFVPGKAILLDASDSELERLYLSLMINPQQRVEIGGHINVPGKTPEELTEKQYQLSVDRAKAVFDYLVEKGIPKKRLSYKGYGNSEMIFSTPTTDAEKSRNRRVEIKILD